MLLPKAFSHLKFC